MAVRTYRGDYAPIGQFGWDGGAGTTAYADPANGLVGILLTQRGRPRGRAGPQPPPARTPRSTGGV